MNVTAIINGCEIGFGQGDAAQYAIEECMDSIDPIYLDSGIIDDVELVFSDVRGSTHPKYAMLKDYYYNARQYF
jgi:hypothetical protein